MMIPFKKGVMHLSPSSPEKNCLIAGRCPSCAAVAFPRRVVCHRCHREGIEEIPLSGKGRLASFTTAWAAPEGFTPPLTLGYIDLPEGVRLLSMISGCEPSSDGMEIGQEMALVFETIRTDDAGNEIVAFKFRPI